jgi:uncharacterized delta-60 repeat protein
MTLFFPAFVSAQVPGYFDTTFNRPYGFATYSTPFMYGERPSAVAMQSDGKIVVVDTHAYAEDKSQIAVIRYNPDGTLDYTFNSPTGINLYDDAVLSFATDVAIQTIQGEEMIVVAGFKSPDQNLYDLILLRYNASGIIDTTFGNEGELVYRNMVRFDAVDTVASLAIQGDSKILVATHTFGVGDEKNLLLLRVNENGTLDESFGSQGVARYYDEGYNKGNVSTRNIAGRRVKITPDGKIAVLIKAFAHTAILKYDPQDNSFTESMPFCGPTGCLVEEPAGALPRGMEVQADGKIVVVGETPTHPFVLRYMEDGSFDDSFGETSGVVYFDYKSHFGYRDDPINSGNARNVAIQQDGKILMVGSCPMDHNGDFLSDNMDVFLARYTSAGNLDMEFGVGGVATFDGGIEADLVSEGDFGEAVVVQSDGKIVVAGSARIYAPSSGYHNDTVIMRFTGMPGPDIDVSPVSYDFGQVPKGANKAQEFSISNTGQSDLAVTRIDLIGDDTAYFNLDPGSCLSLTPTILPGEGCMITVRFAPGTEGLKAATLRIMSNASNARAASSASAEVSLQGTGIAAQSSYTLKVTTDGNGAGIVKSKPKGISCGFNSSACEGLFSAGKEVILYPTIGQENSRFMGWSGACSGRKECKVLMDSDKEVKATFKSEPTIVVWPQSRDFKDVRLGKMKAAFIAVKNSIIKGKRPLNIGAITLSGATPFSIFKDECSRQPLQPKEVCVFGVVFDPDSAGTHTATVNIESDDPESPVKIVSLSGKGVAPPPPKHPRRR